jgi:hypothetical protein
MNFLSQYESDEEIGSHKNDKIVEPSLKFRGKFNVLVYINASSLHPQSSTMFLKIRKTHSSLKPNKFLHLSLSRPLELDFSMIHFMLDYLHKQFSLVKRFSLKFNKSIQILESKENGKFFLTFSVCKKFYEPLEQSVNIVDSALTILEQTVLFYSPPLFHVSFASSDVNISQEFVVTSELNTIKVNSIFCRVGLVDKEIKLSL